MKPKQIFWLPALAAFGQPKTPPPGWESDRGDLMARWALLRRQYREAMAHAQRAADIRRVQLEYRAMAEALVLVAQAMQRAGAPQDAARFYLQAGQSAAALGDAASAGRWLRQAMRMEADVGTRRAARSMLDALPKSASR